MELNMEGEWQEKEKESAEKIQTTLGNMKSYLRNRKLSKKDIQRADGLYTNMTVALQGYPALAKRLWCEPVEAATARTSTMPPAVPNQPELWGWNAVGTLSKPKIIKKQVGPVGPEPTTKGL